MALLDLALNMPRGKLAMKFDLDRARPNEATVLDHFSTGRFYEPEIAEILIRALQPGDTMLDIGANVGVFSVLAAGLVGPIGRVIAFEPAPDNLERLATNLALNDIHNVTIVEAPASDRIENISFHLCIDNEGGHALWDPGQFEPNAQSRANPRSFAARTTTIDAEIVRLMLPTPKVIKIDTEGAEHTVLRGAQALLTGQKVPYIVAELLEFGLGQMGSSQAALRGFMADLGYSMFGIYSGGAMPKLIPPTTALTCDFIVNVLFSTADDVAKLWPIEHFAPRSA